MIVDLKKYSLIDLQKIKNNIDSIKDMMLDIIIINEDGILSVVPCEQIEDVLLQLEESEYIKKSSIYVDKSLISIIGNQLTIDLNKQHADIHDINIFYSLYKNCKFETDKEYYDKHFNELISIRNIERIDYLKELFNKLKLFITHNKIDLELAKLIGNILTDIGIIERLNLIYHLNYIKQNNISDLKNYQNVKKDDLLFADIIGTIVNILDKEHSDAVIFNNISSFKDDNVICHSNRVFVMMVEFLYYYNEEISRGVASKLRVDYKKKYYSYYDEIGKKYNLLTKADRIEDISKVGFRKIEQNEIKYYARAAFWHDIALVDILPNIPIVSSNEGDNHAVLGFNLLKYCMAQNEYTYTTVGLHHEYYGNGYGIFTNMYNKQFANKSYNNIENILTYDANDIDNLTALSYFPAKALEIVDSYDSLYTRISKDSAGNIVNDVISYMYENFLGYDVRIDPIIFYIFIRYLENVRNARIFDCPL
ncbi:hypothetical protein [Brachyspira hampsonii]|uniref:hypothetical protein n=1 Tax=Brachyspira hampsonii TaxID=1287055 RepID=UPI000D38AA7E|nr:hypothetical protein [Brachyspira hampsonii]PTY40903.1 hypothetical protein DQ06_10255 [Brachyspira hampsonii bv. II]